MTLLQRKEILLIITHDILKGNKSKGFEDILCYYN